MKAKRRTKNPTSANPKSASTSRGKEKAPEKPQENRNGALPVVATVLVIGAIALGLGVTIHRKNQAVAEQAAAERAAAEQVAADQAATEQAEAEQAARMMAPKSTAPQTGRGRGPEPANAGTPAPTVPQTSNETSTN